MKKSKKNKRGFIPAEVAGAEIGWWEAHHRKDYDKVVKQMTRLYVLLYGLKRKKAKEIVMFRIEAAKEHDLAEKEGISEQEAKQHWAKATELMTNHFSMLNEALLETE